jgi:hypothetical protein
MDITDQLSIPGVAKVISPAQHAMLDYGVAATYLTLAARYRNTNRAASLLALINGGMVLGVSMFTDYPGGIWRKISFRTHGTLDVMQAALAGLGPALFGFGNREEARTFYGQALSEIGVIAATDWNAAASRT